MKPAPLQGSTSVQGLAQAFFFVCSLIESADSINLGACNLPPERILVCDLLQVLNGRKRNTAAQTSAGLADIRFSMRFVLRRPWLS
jgi:hypothetical protein